MCESSDTSERIWRLARTAQFIRCGSKLLYLDSSFVGKFDDFIFVFRVESTNFKPVIIDAKFCMGKRYHDQKHNSQATDLRSLVEGWSARLANHKIQK